MEEQIRIVGALTMDDHVAFRSLLADVTRRKPKHCAFDLRELESISQENPDKHSPRAKGWFDKVKEFFGD